jgi:hypothetical protein
MLQFRGLFEHLNPDTRKKEAAADVRPKKVRKTLRSRQVLQSWDFGLSNMPSDNPAAYKGLNGMSD